MRRRRLVIPAVLAVTMVTTTVVTVASCGNHGSCESYCIQAEPPGDGGVDAVECPMCADEQGTCPAGCEAIG